MHVFIAIEESAPRRNGRHRTRSFGGLSSYPAVPPRWDDDFCETELEVDRDSVMIHHVARVEVDTEPYSVRRHRDEKQG